MRPEKVHGEGGGRRLILYLPSRKGEKRMRQQHTTMAPMVREEEKEVEERTTLPSSVAFPEKKGKENGDVRSHLLSGPKK